MRPRLATGSLLAFSLALAVGCGGEGGGGAGNTKPLERMKTVPARGIVTYKGKPLNDAAVTFMPLDDGKTLPARGKTDSVGSFVLSTYGDKDGAPVGKYKVLVSVSTAVEVEPGVLAPEPEGGFKSPIPVKYNNVKTTDILMEVKEGDKNDFLIELK